MKKPRVADAPLDHVAGVAILAAAVVVAGADVAWMPRLAAAWTPIGDAGAAAETWFTILVFAPLLLVAAITAGFESRSAFRLGEAPGPAAAAGLLVGLAGFGLVVAFAHVAGSIIPGEAPRAAWSMLLWGAAVVALQAWSEEVYFRGWLQPALARRWGPGAAVVVTAAAFAGPHLLGGVRTPLTLLNLLLGGLIFGTFAVRAGGIAAGTAMHVAWNAAEQLVWGLDPNPGVGSFGALADRDLVGSAIQGGSAEGLNASIMMTSALLAILVPLVMVSWPKLRPGRELASKADAFSSPHVPALRRSGHAPS